MANHDGLIAPDSSYLDQPQAGEPDEALQTLQSVPWVAIALAAHVILLVLAWFIMPPQSIARADTVLAFNAHELAPPPPPLQQPDVESKFPADTEPQTQPTEDARMPDAEDDHAEDPTEQPNRDLAFNPNPDQSNVVSPHPDRTNSNSSVGLAGGASGGSGPGGAGGLFKHRPGGPGGKPPTDEVIPALNWLAEHQNPEGYWSATTFGADSTRTGAARTHNIEFVSPGDASGDKGWEMTVDIGLTGLAILAFTTAGNDHQTGPYRHHLRRAVTWLRRIQRLDGCYGERSDDHWAYNHAICTMAIAELYGLTLHNVLKIDLQRAVDFIVRSQNVGMGWRYDVAGGTNDSSVTGWMVLALHTAEYVGIDFDKTQVYDGAAKWYETVTVDVDGYARCGYDTPGSLCSRLRSASEVYDNTPSMDAIYIMSMVFMGKSEVKDKRIREMANGCAQNPPEWTHGKLDFYYWYYASLALYQVGGSTWERWEAQMKKVLLRHQRGNHPEDVKNGLTSPELLDEHGSWDAVDAWSTCGGRVYSTAMGVLILESLFRYERLTKGK
jgi:hypothetical protein